MTFGANFQNSNSILDEAAKSSPKNSKPSTQDSAFKAVKQSSKPSAAGLKETNSVATFAPDQLSPRGDIKDEENKSQQQRQPQVVKEKLDSSRTEQKN